MCHRPEAIHTAIAHSKTENSALETNDEIDKISVLPASFFKFGKIIQTKKRARDRTEEIQKKFRRNSEQQA